jgi:hypothetical protein
MTTSNPIRKMMPAVLSRNLSMIGTSALHVDVVADLGDAFDVARD